MLTVLAAGPRDSRSDTKAVAEVLLSLEAGALCASIRQPGHEAWAGFSIDGSPISAYGIGSDAQCAVVRRIAGGRVSGALFDGTALTLEGTPVGGPGGSPLRLHS